MPVFNVEQYELHAQTYRVEAETEAEAIAKLFAGEGEPLDGGLDFIEVAEGFGLPADQHLELAESLRAQGVTVDAVIPSIRGVVRVE